MSLTQEQKNKNYNRERKAMSDWLKKDVDYEETIRNVHEASRERIENKIDGFYIRYAQTEGLTRAEAMKKASDFDVRQYFERAERAVREEDFSDETNEWLRLYNLKMKTSRLEVMKAEINLELLKMYEKDYQFVDDEVRKEAMKEMERQQQVLEDSKNQAGILANSAASPVKDLEAIVYADFYGANFSERIWSRTGYYQTLQKDIFSSLNNIFTDMEGYQKEKAYLMGKFDATEYEVLTLLKTETNRVRSDMRDTMYEENGFTHYQNFGEPDMCDYCKEFDGKIFKVSERKVGINSAPFHPRCKCSDSGIIEMKRKDGRSNLEDYEAYERG